MEYLGIYRKYCTETTIDEYFENEVIKDYLDSYRS